MNRWQKSSILGKSHESWDGIQHPGQELWILGRNPASWAGIMTPVEESSILGRNDRLGSLYSEGPAGYMIQVYMQPYTTGIYSHMQLYAAIYSHIQLYLLVHGRM